MADLNPHVSNDTGFAPLADLMSRALRRFGDAATMQPTGDLSLLLLDMANLIVDEVNQHPYWDIVERGIVPYYTHPSDRRPIPDAIVTAGLAGLYAAQQSSEKAGMLLNTYYRTLNSTLWYNLAGNTRIRARSFDKVETDPINGFAKSEVP